MLFCRLKATQICVSNATFTLKLVFLIYISPNPLHYKSCDVMVTSPPLPADNEQQRPANTVNEWMIWRSDRVIVALVDLISPTHLRTHSLSWLSHSVVRRLPQPIKPRPIAASYLEYPLSLIVLKTDCGMAAAGWTQCRQPNWQYDDDGQYRYGFGQVGRLLYNTRVVLAG